MQIQKVAGLELHHQYKGQTKPLRVKLFFNPEARRVWCATAPDGTVTFNEYHRRILSWGIPALKADAANLLMERLSAKFEAIAAGFETEWDGNNMVGRYDADASAAIEEIETETEALFEDEDVRIRVWNAADYFGALGGWKAQCAELGIDLAIADEALEGIAEREREAAAREGIDVLEGLEAHLEWLRTKCCEGVAA